MLWLWFESAFLTFHFVIRNIFNSFHLFFCLFSIQFMKMCNKQSIKSPKYKHIFSFCFKWFSFLASQFQLWSLMGKKICLSFQRKWKHVFVCNKNWIKFYYGGTIYETNYFRLRKSFLYVFSGKWKKRKIKSNENC